MLTVPAKSACSLEHEIVMGGSGSGSGSGRTSYRSAMAFAIAHATSVSVPSGRCRPCCSKLPTGSTATVAARSDRPMWTLERNTILLSWCLSQRTDSPKRYIPTPFENPQVNAQFGQRPQGMQPEARSRLGHVYDTTRPGARVPSTVSASHACGPETVRASEIRYHNYHTRVYEKASDQRSRRSEAFTFPGVAGEGFEPSKLSRRICSLKDAVLRPGSSPHEADTGTRMGHGAGPLGQWPSARRDEAIREIFMYSRSDFPIRMKP